MKKEIYISTDIEADGPIPGPFSMLSFASAAFEIGNPKPIATFEANLETIEGAGQDPGTMDWWATQPEAWAECRKDLQKPEGAMPKYLAWLQALPGKPVFIGYPVCYDFMFVYWYCHRFGNLAPGTKPAFGHSGLDLKSIAFYKLGGNYHEATKRNMPRAWFAGAPKHTHKAIDDAIGQGVLFVNMLK